MVSSVALDTQRIALDLHSLLRDLDSARRRAALDTSLRARRQEIGEGISRLVDATWPEETLGALQLRLAEVRDVLARYAPADGCSAADATRAWLELRAHGLPAYEALARTLRDVGGDVPSLRPTNVARNGFHLASGTLIIVVVALFLPTFASRVAVAGPVCALAWSLEAARRADPRINTALMHLFRHVAHPQEAVRVNSATWYATAILILTLFFSPVVASAGVAVLTLGDPMAALIGRRFGRIELVARRTLEGSLAFVVFGGAAACVTLAWIDPAPVGNVLARGLVAGATGALAELLAGRVDDNLAVPVAAALALALQACL